MAASMAASKSFHFEEREFTEASNAQLAPGSVPDFEAVSRHLSCPPHPRLCASATRRARRGTPACCTTGAFQA